MIRIRNYKPVVDAIPRAVARIVQCSINPQQITETARQITRASGQQNGALSRAQRPPKLYCVDLARSCHKLCGSLCPIVDRVLNPFRPFVAMPWRAAILYIYIIYLV